MTYEEKIQNYATEILDSNEIEQILLKRFEDREDLTQNKEILFVSFGAYIISKVKMDTKLLDLDPIEYAISQIDNFVERHTVIEDISNKLLDKLIDDLEDGKIDIERGRFLLFNTYAVVTDIPDELAAELKVNEEYKIESINGLYDEIFDTVKDLPESQLIYPNAETKAYFDALILVREDDDIQE